MMTSQNSCEDYSAMLARRLRRNTGPKVVSQYFCEGYTAIPLQNSLSQCRFNFANIPNLTWKKRVSLENVIMTGA